MSGDDPATVQPDLHPDSPAAASGDPCRDHYTDDAATVTPTLSWPIWIAVASALAILSMGGQRVDLAFEQGAVEGQTAREVKGTSARSLIVG